LKPKVMCLRLLRFWGSGLGVTGRPGPPRHGLRMRAPCPSATSPARALPLMSFTIPAGRPINERHAPGDSRASYPNGGPHAADPGADAAASLRGAEANEANAASAVPD
jgi:hypothetical protein